jgi:acetyltransferase
MLSVGGWEARQLASAKKLHGKKQSRERMARMEIYPSRYEMSVNLRDGTEVFLRPVKETDGPLLLELFKELSPSSVRPRFLSVLHGLPGELITQFTHADYKKSFGLAGLIKIENAWPIIGVARYAYDSERELPELAVVVRDDWHGKGLGSILLSRVIGIGKENGFSRFEAMIDSQNKTIMHIFRQIGVHYKICRKEQEAYVIEIQA